MSVKIIIKRMIQKDKIKDITPLISQLRVLATNQLGYISGETLKSIDHPGEYMVISTWQAVDDWKRWVLSKERNEIQSKIDELLGEKTDYGIYTY
ncbi:Antibiotic biosynthesis monooxygenase [Candidatus Magnetomoraceae bacterium gMMP-15]